MLIKFPTFIIGFFAQMLAQRFNWVVEFLYPTGVGRWVHFFLMRMSARSKNAKPNDKSYGYHSRAMETRFEVVRNRVYIHPLPQFMDNLGYLVVCLPPSSAQSQIVGFVVDVGDAQAVARQVSLISNLHYQMRPICLQSILSTHKHHDHTAGNIALQRTEIGSDIKIVFGGAVEDVPGCTFPLANGDKLPLPRDDGNDMQSVVEVEAIATPGHTRGSLAYALRPLDQSLSTMSSILFTGDTMFSGGGGVPFESDIDPNQEGRTANMTGDSYIKASAATYAVERCFAEILYRCVPGSMMKSFSSDRVIVLPGHEYTYELLNRQLPQPTESSRWKLFSPKIFFETASSYYVAMHRSTLPSTSGRVLSAPSSIQQQLSINPNLRSLRRRADVIVSALRFWNSHFSKAPVNNEVVGGFGRNGMQTNATSQGPEKTRATEKQWNLDANDINSQVFTTVYSTDLDSIIADLDAGAVNPRKAAERLRRLKQKLDSPVVGRRPIPGTLPSNRVIYKGLLGLAILGSSPTALAPSDSKAMKISPSVGDSSDDIVVSKKHLIAVLYWLGLLTDVNDGNRIVKIIERLWSEARELESNQASIKREDVTYDTVDVEASATTVALHDKVDLGTLKWLLYGIPRQQIKSFPQFCSPCAKPKYEEKPEDHPIETCGMLPENGEFVRHDIFSCMLCRVGAGCPAAAASVSIVQADSQPDDEGVMGDRAAPLDRDRYIIGQSSEADDDSAFVEVSSDILQMTRYE